ncbi:hypothetical protein GCK72_021508 [Caenorhabditis remanei]|uniref:CUB-like domain-containing protein n=1 Tax=Caenorhabditis remanei TaxID=31234 RepID=A0A6A5GJU5_CAERE|nr:hypothetical protein GCK72_021508 [Caenorhabditis remanei]KAF1754943.1 hypothetical protein GCK72_021508 [Caenorhabditis remanei]
MKFIFLEEMISVAQDSFYKLYASVELKNGIRGVNDYIVVTEENGNTIRMNNRTGIGGNLYRYIVTPGGEMTIEVVTKNLFMNTKMAISVYYRAYCKQLQISDGQTISIPGNSLQPIPAHYSCTYLIAAPTSPTTGLYANVTLISNMNGIQDKIIVTDITGANVWDRDINYYNYIVIPGSSMSFQIKTGELFMASMFLIRVEWHEVNIGPTKPMIRDEINYVDLGLL